MVVGLFGILLFPSSSQEVVIEFSKSSQCSQYVPRYVSNSITLFCPNLSSFHYISESQREGPYSMVCIWRIETFTLGGL